MKKNVSGQSIGTQMVNASDNTAFTGTVTVYITIDNGTQTIGSVGSGVCTHEGNGYHSYAPSQGETNGNHVAFTFIGSGAKPATLQFYTEFPLTAAQAGYIDNLSAGAAALEATVQAIKAKTDLIGTSTDPDTITILTKINELRELVREFYR